MLRYLLVLLYLYSTNAFCIYPTGIGSTLHDIKAEDALTKQSEKYKSNNTTHLGIEISTDLSRKQANPFLSSGKATHYSADDIKYLKNEHFQESPNDQLLSLISITNLLKTFGSAFKKLSSTQKHDLIKKLGKTKISYESSQTPLYLENIFDKSGKIRQNINLNTIDAGVVLFLSKKYHSLQSHLDKTEKNTKHFLASTNANDTFAEEFFKKAFVNRIKALPDTDLSTTASDSSDSSDDPNSSDESTSSYESYLSVASLDPKARARKSKHSLIPNQKECSYLATTAIANNALTRSITTEDDETEFNSTDITSTPLNISTLIDAAGDSLFSKNNRTQLARQITATKRKGKSKNITRKKIQHAEKYWREQIRKAEHLQGSSHSTVFTNLFGASSAKLMANLDAKQKSHVIDSSSDSNSSSSDGEVCSGQVKPGTITRKFKRLAYI